MNININIYIYTHTHSLYTGIWGSSLQSSQKSGAWRSRRSCKERFQMSQSLTWGYAKPTFPKRICVSSHKNPEDSTPQTLKSKSV